MMPLLPRSRLRREPPPIPRRPYRDAAIAYGVMAAVLVVVAWLTGGDVGRAVLVAVAFFTVATAWSWWRLRERIKGRALRAAAAAGRLQREEE